jgi:hypothetical protein
VRTVFPAQFSVGRLDLLDQLALERCGLRRDLMRSDLEKLWLQAKEEWPFPHSARLSQ